MSLPKKLHFGGFRSCEVAIISLDSFNPVVIQERFTFPKRSRNNHPKKGCKELLGFIHSNPTNICLICVPTHPELLLELVVVVDVLLDELEVLDELLLDEVLLVEVEPKTSRQHP